MKGQTINKERTESGMELAPVSEIVRSLRNARKRRDLSIPDVKNLVDSTGYIISESTYYRIFSDDVDCDSINFNYETILRPIAKVLSAPENASQEIQPNIMIYESVLNYKAEVIESLKTQIEHIKAENERHCAALEEHMETLRKQIDLKDMRMERKDDIIARLMDKLL